MAYLKFSRLTSGSEEPADRWLYKCDNETDIPNLPADCEMVMVIGHDSTKSLYRVRDTSGAWKEMK